MSQNNQTPGEIGEILKDPKAAFEQPADVLCARNLTDREKRLILESWREDALALERASGEAMTGGEQGQLNKVDEALATLEPHQRAAKGQA